MAVVAGAAPTALWHTAHCRLCEPVWATGRRACRAGCLGLSMFGPFCHVCGSLLRRVHRSCVSRRGGGRAEAFQVSAVRVRWGMWF